MNAVPPEVLECIIDTFEDSKADLLHLASVNRGWLPRSRFHLIQEFCTDLSFDTPEALAAFSDLARVGISSLLHHDYRSLTIAGPEALLIRSCSGSNPWQFLQNITVTDCVHIHLDSVVSELESSTFPWETMASWTTLTGVTLGGTLPSLATVALVIAALPQLQDLVIDATYLDTSAPTSKGKLSTDFASLTLGSHGYALFSWLASLDDTELYLGNVALTVDLEDVSPLHAFAVQHGDAISCLAVTLLSDRITDLVSSLKLLRDVSDMEFYLKYRPMQSYSQCIQSLATSVASASLETLSIYIPELPDAQRGAILLQRLAKASMTAATDLASNEVDIAIYPRSWMTPYSI